MCTMQCSSPPKWYMWKTISYKTQFSEILHFQPVKICQTNAEHTRDLLSVIIHQMKHIFAFAHTHTPCTKTGMKQQQTNPTCLFYGLVSFYLSKNNLSQSRHGIEGNLGGAIFSLFTWSISQLSVLLATT